MDVKALYTNITNNESIAGAKRKHDKYTKNRSLKSDNYILSSYFEIRNLIFDSKFYLQIKGCTVVIKYAPT